MHNGKAKCLFHDRVPVIYNPIIVITIIIYQLNLYIPLIVVLYLVHTIAINPLKGLTKQVRVFCLFGA